LLSETRHCEIGSRRGRSALLAICLAVGACSSDSLPETEPEVQHAGAFIAVGDAHLALYRTLKALRIEGDTIMFMTLYEVVPGSFDHAREVAKQPAIPIRQELVTVSKALLLSQRHQVVWFRTLTKAEEDRAP
jgi:hypothetical protein